eukprot:1061455-Alexandrium_andersonii.AAC.1
MSSRSTNVPCRESQSSTRQTARRTRPAGASKARGPRVFPDSAAAWATDRAVVAGQQGAPPTP